MCGRGSGRWDTLAEVAYRHYRIEAGIAFAVLAMHPAALLPTFALLVAVCVVMVLMAQPPLDNTKAFNAAVARRLGPAWLAEELKRHPKEPTEAEETRAAAARVWLLSAVGEHKATIRGRR